MRVPVSSFKVTGKRPKVGGLFSPMNNEALVSFLDRIEERCPDHIEINFSEKETNPEAKERYLKDLGLDGPIVDEEY